MVHGRFRLGKGSVHVRISDPVGRLIRLIPDSCLGEGWGCLAAHRFRGGESGKRLIPDTLALADCVSQTDRDLKRSLG